jgi:NitT/TauT family transport system ATP-binding protein
MQQRVSLARALVHDPELLFMDEPFGALDAITREELILVLQEIHMAERKTVLFVTHDIGEAVFLADRVLVFSDRPSRLAARIDVPLNRPRTNETRASREFREIDNEVRSALSLG